MRISAGILIAILLTGVAKETPAQLSISDALLIDKNIKTVLNVYKEMTNIYTKIDSMKGSEIWFVPNGISIPNYMLRASREIERCNGKVHWMRQISGNRAQFRYEGEQGIYPIAEIRVTDTLWLPNSSKLAVVLAAKEQNTILKNNPELLEKLNFSFSILIPSSRPELLEAGKKANANIIPWIPMESREMVYDSEKKNQISIGIANEKELSRILDLSLKKFGNAKGFAALYGEDFLAHPASMEKFGKILQSKNLWFWDLSKRGSATLTMNECKKRDVKCRKDYLDAESPDLIKNVLRAARKKGDAILLFELNEKSIELLKGLPSVAEKQGTKLVFAEEVF